VGWGKVGGGGRSLTLPNPLACCCGVTSFNPASLWKQKATCINYDTTHFPEYKMRTFSQIII